MKEPNAPTDQESLVDFSTEDLIRQFGGIRPMAAKLSVPVTTVQGWKSRGRIPMNRRHAILEAARSHNINLSDIAKREQSKKLVTMTPVAGSVRIEKDSEEKETVAEGYSTEKTSKADELSGHANQAMNKKLSGYFPKVSGKFRLLFLLFISFIVMGGIAIYFQSDFFRFGPASADLENVKDHVNLKKSEPPLFKKAHPQKKSAAKTPAFEPSAQLIEQPLLQNKPPIKKADGVDTKQPMPSGEKAAEMKRQVVAQITKEASESPDRRPTALVEKTIKLGEADKMFLRAMKGELSEFREQMASMRKDLNQLSRELNSLKTIPLVSGERIALHALLLGQLEAEVFSGRPYRAPLDRLGESVGNAEVRTLLKGLERYADKGVPTKLMLVNEFQVLTRKRYLVPNGSMGADWASEGFWNWFAAQLKSLVSVRRTSGSGTVQPLSKAEAAVARGDFERAVGHLEQTGSPAAALWMADARAYINARKIIGKLRLQVSTLLRGLNTPK